MEKHGVFTNLFMSTVGVIFLVGGIALFCLGVKIVTDNIYIRIKGIEREAVITYKSKSSRHTYTNYSIRYDVNSEEYKKSFNILKNSYQEGDIIKIYYLQKNPTKIFIPIQSISIVFDIISIIVISVVLMFLGYLCIYNYNIFKYKRIIRVE